MKLLLDTHVVLWWLADLPLDVAAHDAIADGRNELFVSAASVWEIAIKRSCGKLKFDGDVLDSITSASMSVLPIDGYHAVLAGALPAHHRDPFDRILVAQAITERMTIVTRHKVMAKYGVASLPA
jgi:PIN domain nuclease of toxin-antitoxin system